MATRRKSDNRTLIQKAINKSLTLDQFLTEASQVEDTRLQVHVQQMHPDNTAHKLRATSKHFDTRDQWTRFKQEKCSYCGLSGVHEPGRNCPAYGKTCKRCKFKKHFESVCRTAMRSQDDRKSRGQGRYKPINSKRKGRVKRASMMNFLHRQIDI